MSSQLEGSANLSEGSSIRSRRRQRLPSDRGWLRSQPSCRELASAGPRHPIRRIVRAHDEAAAWDRMRRRRARDPRGPAPARRRREADTARCCRRALRRRTARRSASNASPCGRPNRLRRGVTSPSGVDPVDAVVGRQRRCGHVQRAVGRERQMECRDARRQRGERRALPSRSTLKIVPDRSPTNSVPSGANASPQATPRSLANGSDRPVQSRRDRPCPRTGSTRTGALRDRSPSTSD